ncbi:transposable element Tcb1 transposase [Trichonephila clavipes]|nr:transposable element Tcb1 transposase [Trichonephila clavipes]
MPVPPNTLRVHTDYVLVKSVGPKVMWTESRVQEKIEKISLHFSSMPKLWRKIGSRVGRNKTTVMRICDRWMKEGTTDRCGRSHPPQCTTSREDRQFVHMAVMDRSVTSRTVAQHIKSVTHHSVYTRAIRCRLQ